MRSFELVDTKVAEADFFLKKLSQCGFNLFELSCYLSAFVSSSRSTTFSLQSVMKGHDDFDGWYKQHQEIMKTDKLSKFFNNFRRVSQHIGVSPYGGGEFSDNKILHYFGSSKDLPDVSKEDIITSCNNYFTSVVELIYDAYLIFGASIDAQQYFTSSNFVTLGKTIEDAEEELGLPRGWTDIGDPDAEEYRWEALRNTTTGCEINHIFEQYLNKIIACSDKLPPYVPKNS